MQVKRTKQTKTPLTNLSFVQERVTEQLSFEFSSAVTDRRLARPYIFLIQEPADHTSLTLAMPVTWQLWEQRIPKPRSQMGMVQSFLWHWRYPWSHFTMTISSLRMWLDVSKRQKWKIRIFQLSVKTIRCEFWSMVKYINDCCFK